MIRRKPDDGLRAEMRKHLPQVHWSSIETGATMGGFPDVCGIYRSRTFFVEAKATRAWAIRFKPLQVGWHMRCAREGGTSFVATRRRPGGLSEVDELWLHEGRHADIIEAGGLRAAPPLSATCGGPSRWNWEAVLQTLLGG